MLTMALDNNSSEAFNAVVKRKLGRRMGTGHEVYSHFLETSTILDALLTRGTFCKYDAIRLPLLDNKRLYLVASSNRSQQQLRKTDIKNFEARNHVLLKHWESAVLSIYAVRWLLGEWVCQCISFCQSGQCHHVGMVNKAAAESSATRSKVMSANDDLKDASADPQGSPSSSVWLVENRISCNWQPKNSRWIIEEKWPSAVLGSSTEKNKTDTMPLRSEDQPDLPPG
ncbi:hypothetical protein FOZ61_001944, partial [Perkinsus olseni]